jgi:uncharacterized lipoprotein YmbA
MRRALYVSIAIFFTATASVLSSCSPLSPQADPSRFYVLGWSISDEERATRKLDNVVVGLGPFQLAPYLDRPQIVTRVAANEVSVSQIDRWAEPLDEAIQALVQQNLLVIVDPAELVPHPWTSVRAPDYSIVYAVNRFERNSDGDAELTVLWAVRYPKSGKRRGELRESTIVEPVGSESTQDLVRGLSRALARLSFEFAEAIQEAHASSAGQ